MTNEQLQELADLQACGNHSWHEVGQHFGLSWQAARGRWRRNCQDLVPGPCPLCESGDSEPSSSWEETGNYAQATVTGPRVQTLEQLLAAAEVDLRVWRVVDWGVKKWEVGAKIELGDLEFDAGRITGHLSKRGIGVQDLWSVWAKFVRIQPVALRPVIQPVLCPITYQPGKTSTFRAERALLISDLHIGYFRENRTGKLVPFHDRAAIDAVFQVVESYRAVLDTVLILGDLLDLTNWNDKFARQPEFYWTTQPSILEAHWLLRRLREILPHAKIVWLPGNHEDRMRKAIEKHLLEAYQLRAADELDLPPALSPEKLLALDALGIEYESEYPGAERWLGPLRASHGDVARQPPGASARAVVEKTMCDNAFGHTHRLEMVSKVVRGRRGELVQLKSLSIGCLCHVDGRVPGSDKGDNWQKGFALVTYTESSWSPTLVSLDSGEAVVGGLAFRGESYVEELRHDLPDWNW